MGVAVGVAVAVVGVGVAAVVSAAVPKHDDGVGAGKFS